MFVADRKRTLNLQPALRVRQLIRVTLAISRFEQARPESAMHLDGASDYAARQLIKFHLRALRELRVLRGAITSSLARVAERFCHRFRSALAQGRHKSQRSRRRFLRSR